MPDVSEIPQLKQTTTETCLGLSAGLSDCDTALSAKRP